MLRLCYAVNAVAAITYAVLVVWALATKESAAGSSLLFFAPWALTPYVVLSLKARSCQQAADKLLILFVVSVLCVASGIFVHYNLVQYIEREHDMLRDGARSSGPPASLIGAFWMFVLPLLQLG